jgi:hydrogenase nickel incorporation protein HypA/HybF
MHELSIAQNIIDIVEQELDKQADTEREVKTLELEIGTLSGVVIEALETAMDSAVKDTALKEANIKINKIQAQAQCQSCEKIFEISDLYDPCPKCDSFNPKIIKGKELRVKSIEVV